MSQLEDTGLSDSDTLADHSSLPEAGQHVPSRPTLVGQGPTVSTRLETCSDAYIATSTVVYGQVGMPVCLAVQASASLIMVL